MGRPHHTADVPGVHPRVERELRLCAVDPFGHVADLVRAVTGDGMGIAAGHLCATAWILDPTGAALLLVRHATLGWSSPGGHLEPGESSFDAVVREVQEETGLELPALRAVLPGPLTVHVTDTGEPNHRHWNIAYLFVADTGTSLRREADAPDGAAGELRWYPVDALPLEQGPPDLAIVTSMACQFVHTN